MPVALQPILFILAFWGTVWLILYVISCPKTVTKWFNVSVDETTKQITLIAIFGVIVMVLGYFALNGLKAWNDLLSNFFSNALIEFVSIGITILVLDRLYAKRAAHQEKERIIRQMASHSNDFALDAVAQVVENRWHVDGSLQGRYLAYANLQDANLDLADLQNANLQGAKLQNATLSFANLQRANLQGAKLKGTSLDYANLQEANLTVAELQGANLQNADLQSAKLDYANLREVNLIDANLQGASLDCTNLEDVALPGAKLEGARYTIATRWPKGFKPNAAGAILMRREDETDASHRIV